MNRALDPTPLAALGTLLAVLLGAPADLVAEEACDSAEKFAQAGRAMDGDRDAMAAIAEQTDSSGCLAFPNWVLAAAHRELGELDASIEHYREALALGDELASLALAQTMHEAERPIEAYAWAQVALWQRFDREEIEAGAADGGMEMALLRASVAAMSESDNGEAEALAGEYLKRWVDEAPVVSGESGDTRGWEPVYRRPPEFPAGKARRSQPGWVHAVLLVDAEGETEAVRILASSHPDFSRQARRAMGDWAFEPPEDAECGQHMTQTLMFDLN